MSARWWTLVVCALAAASALFWGLRIFTRPLPVPPQAQLVEPGAGQRADLTRLLGADAPPPVAAEAPPPAADARFNLVGVVNPRAPQAAREGLALIAVDGKPARAYRVGAVIEGTHVLKSVSARGATLGQRDGPQVIALNIAPPPPPATGTLPPAQSASPVPLPSAVPAAPAAPPVRPFRLPGQAGQLPSPAPPEQGAPLPMMSPGVPLVRPNAAVQPSADEAADNQGGRRRGANRRSGSGGGGETSAE